MEDKVMEQRSRRASRNKENYLKAKAAFNQKDMAGCMSYYAPDITCGRAMSGLDASISSRRCRQHVIAGRTS
jgi:ketosteroid isomerase-like protein